MQKPKKSLLIIKSTTYRPARQLSLVGTGTPIIHVKQSSEIINRTHMPKITIQRYTMKNDPCQLLLHYQKNCSTYEIKICSTVRLMNVRTYLFKYDAIIKETFHPRFNKQSRRCAWAMAPAHSTTHHQICSSSPYAQKIRFVRKKGLQSRRDASTGRRKGNGARCVGHLMHQ
jgi:hypothetical protein